MSDISYRATLHDAAAAGVRNAAVSSMQISRPLNPAADARAHTHSADLSELNGVFISE